MIRPEQVWLAVEPVDMRMGIDGLSLQIQQALGRSPCDGTAYAFRNRSGNTDQVAGLGWNRGLAVCPASASGALHLAPQHGCRVHAECGRMAVARPGSRLASPPGQAAGCLAGLRPHIPEEASVYKGFYT